MCCDKVFAVDKSGRCDQLVHTVWKDRPTVSTGVVAIIDSRRRLSGTLWRRRACWCLIFGRNVDIMIVVRTSTAKQKTNME